VSTLVVMDSLTSGRTVLLLGGDSDATWVVARRERRRDRLTAWMRAQSLDEQLARGESPDDGRARSARAALLVSPRTRERLARCWEGLLDRAQQPSGVPGPHVPLPRARILATADDIRAVAAALRARRPVPARGVAMANLLVRDGTGPLYDRRAVAPDLRAVLREITDRLDASAELLASPPA